MDKEYFFNEGTNEQNLWAYLYMECNDYNKEHMLNAFQGVDDEELHKNNVQTVKWLCDNYGLEGFLSSFSADADSLKYDYTPMPIEEECFENTFYRTVAEAIADDIEFDENEMSPTDSSGVELEGTAKYKGKEFYFTDSAYSSTPSHKLGAAIDLISKTLEGVAEKEQKKSKSVERE